MAVSPFSNQQAADASPQRLAKLPDGIDVDFSGLARKLWRRKTSLLGVTVLGTVLAILIVNQITPRYTARALVMLDPRENKAVNVDAVLSGLPADQETVASEIEVLLSRGLAERVVSKLKLYNDPTFNVRLQGESRWKSWRNSLVPEVFRSTKSLKSLFGSSTSRPPTEEAILNRERISIINSLLGRIAVDRVGRSRVIEIAVTHTSGQKAAEVANSIADLYIVEQLEAKFDATKRATGWLNERLTGLRAAVQKSERAVEIFRKASGLVEGKGVTLASQQISELNTQLILARSKRAEADARLRQVRELMQRSSSVESLAEVLSSSLIQGLRSQEAEIDRRAAELSQEYGEKHPSMINIRAEIADIRRKIAGEVRKIVQGLRNEVEVARARESEFTNNLRQLETRVASLNQREVQLRALEREAEANRTLYGTFLSRFKETSEQKEFHKPDARVISRAEMTSRPSSPRKNLIIVVAFILSAGAAVVMVFVLESLDKGFRSTEEIEAMIGIPSLGLLPAVSGLTKGKTVEGNVLEQPNSAYSESIRSLYVALLLSNVDKPPQTVLITSSLPNEGKTSLALSLARQVASSMGKRVIVIDCDLRRPVVHEHLAMDFSPGIVQLLAEETTLDRVLQRDEPSGAFVITAGGNPLNPLDILSSKHFADLLDHLKSAFDLVVIDSPPVLAVSDARILAGLVDKTIFAVRWAETRREVVRMGVKQMIEAGADLVGLPLTRVNVRKHAQYGYGDSGYYHGHYKKYYSDRRENEKS